MAFGVQGYNGGSVEVVGWKRKQSDSTDSLSFWIAVGPSGHFRRAPTPRIILRALLTR